jgi:threonine synthase
VPVEEAVVAGQPVHLLREDRNPSGSCKDRGAAVAVSALVRLGARRLVTDSSGNGALALASYARVAGLELRALVPEDLSEAKRQAILAAGAELKTRRKPRTELAGEARREAVDSDSVYAGLGEDPYALEGQKTAAFHVQERLSGRSPDIVAVPFGEGALLRGLARGFGELVRQGMASRVPRLVGVRCERGIAELEPGDPKLSAIAEAEARRSGGGIVSVSPLELDLAWRRQWWEGRMLELAAVAPVAWLESTLRRGGRPEGSVVLVVTGSGTRAGQPVAVTP